MSEAKGDLTARADTRSVVFVASLGVSVVALHALGAFGPFSDAALGVLGIFALAIAVIGIRRWRPLPAWPWWLQAVALGLFLLGGLARATLGTLGDLSPDRSLLPDLLTLPGYAFLAVSVVALIRLRRGSGTRDLDATLDAGVAGIAALTLAWVYLINPALSQQHVPLNIRLLLVCYPAMSVSLVALGARLAFGSGAKRPMALRFIMSTFIFVLVGDVLYMFADAGLATIPSQLVDIPYGLAYVAVMATFLHPSMRDVGLARARCRAGYRGSGRLAFLAVALSVPAVITLGRTERGLGDRLVLSAIVILCTVAAAWRMMRALRESARAEARLAHQATHDGLTDLPNRSLVQDHLTRSLGRDGPPERDRPALPRHRPLQAGQRLAGPRRRRRPADGGGRAPRVQPAARRPRGPHRRRRVRDRRRATCATSSHAAGDRRAHPALPGPDASTSATPRSP